MTEVKLATPAATAALEVVIELIRAGELKLGVGDEKADKIISVHQKLTEHFDSFKAPQMKISPNALR